MTQPGWYPDQTPGLLRWWDGTRWTEHTQPMPAAATPGPQPSAAPRLPEQPPIIRPPTTQPSSLEGWLDKKRAFKADGHAIRGGDQEVLTSEIDTIRLFHVVENPQGATIQRYNVHLRAGETTLKLRWLVPGRDRSHPYWTGLIAILDAHVVPRLVQEAVNRVWSGEEVEVAGVTVSLAGLSGRSGLRKVQVPWQSITDIRGRGEYLEIHGSAKLKVPGGADNRIVLAPLTHVMMQAVRGS